MNSYEIHPQYGIADIAYSPDGHLLATASSDHTSLLIDVATSKIIRTVQSSIDVSSVLFTKDNKKLLVYTSDRVLKLFDLDSADAQSQLLPQLLLDKGVPITTMSIRPDGKTVALAGTGRAPWLISLNDATVTQDAFDCDDRIMAAAFSADGKWLAGGGNEGTVYLWNPADHPN